MEASLNWNSLSIMYTPILYIAGSSGSDIKLWTPPGTDGDNEEMMKPVVKITNYNSRSLDNADRGVASWRKNLQIIDSFFFSTS